MGEKTIHRIELPHKPKSALPRVRRVAAYARVSTNSTEQEMSLEAQQSFFETFIHEHADWLFVEVYYDDGISGLGYRNREGFNRMISDALGGRINLIVTKSLSRFARNTVDALIIIRKLKASGVEVFFQKEDIYTFDSKGEFMISLMSIFAQEESRSISENVKWGHRKRFADGKYSVPYAYFLGYKRGAKGELVIDSDQAVIVKFIYWLYLQRHTNTNYIANLLTTMGIPTPAGKINWNSSVIISILSNEKYAGDALLQKRFVVDYLTKKTKKNEGELPQYYVRDGHPAIISRPAWEEVQMLLKRQHERRRDRSQKRYANIVVCSHCGTTYGPKRWFVPGNPGYHRTVWECNRRYKIKHDPTPAHFYEDELAVSFSAALQYLYDREKEELLSVLGKCCSQHSMDAVIGAADAFQIDASVFTSAEYDVMTIILSTTSYPDYHIEFVFSDGDRFNFQYTQESLQRGTYSKTMQRLMKQV